ncbi:hypothetical protein [Salinibacter altiplanensis]|uniref:hypothetical protein n=1 Tax=Salinibacter altiplanensis TaxID=1803181 RepID=UPI0018E419AF|nr:hypothetical protein [Salinibacter altiplanensis]
MAPSEPDLEPPPWWGTVSLDVETGGRWAVGPSTLWLYRTDREWRIIHRWSSPPEAPDPLADRSEVTVPLPEDELADVLDTEDEETLHTNRYSFGETDPRISLQPALADRPVVSRPEHPLYVPPDESVTLYLSTALWIRIVLPDSDRKLQEIPSFRMSDTWFGATTTDGEFCYATRTAGWLRLDRLPRRLHRAVTPLRIRNTAPDPLALERVQLPVQHLALYTTPTHQLWTQGVTMTRSAAQEGADIQVRSGPPADADEAELLQERRESAKRGLFTSTFSAVGTLFAS